MNGFKFLFSLLCFTVGVLGQKDHDIPCEIRSRDVCEEAEGCLWKGTTCAQIQLKKTDYNQYPQHGQTGQYNSRTMNQPGQYNSHAGQTGQYNSRTMNQPGQYNSHAGNQPMGQYNSGGHTQYGSNTGGRTQYGSNTGGQMQNGMSPQMPGQPGQHGAMPGYGQQGAPGQMGQKNECGCQGVFTRMDPPTRSFTQYRQPRCQDCGMITGPPGMQTAQMCNSQYWITESCEIALCVWEIDECEDRSAHDHFECNEITSMNECPLVPGCQWMGTMCNRAGAMNGQMPGQMPPGQFPPHHYALQKTKPEDKIAPVSVWSWSTLLAFLVGVLISSLLYLSYRVCKKASLVVEPLHFVEI